MRQVEDVKRGRERQVENEMALSQQHPSSNSSTSASAKHYKNKSSRQSRHEDADSRYPSAVGRREMLRQKEREKFEETETENEQVTGEHQEQQVFSIDVGGKPSSRTSSGSSSGYNGRPTSSLHHFYPTAHHLHYHQQQQHGFQYESSSGQPLARSVRVQVSDPCEEQDNYDAEGNVELSLESLVVGCYDPRLAFDVDRDIIGEPSSSLIDDDVDATFQQHPAPTFQYKSHHHQQRPLQCADSELLHHSSLAIYHQQQVVPERMRHEALLRLGRQASHYNSLLAADQSVRQRPANELIDTSKQHRSLVYAPASIKKKARPSSSTKHHKSRDTLAGPGANTRHLYYQQPQFAPTNSLNDPSSYHHLFPQQTEVAHQHHLRYLQQPEDASYSYLEPVVVHERETQAFYREQTAGVNNNKQQQTTNKTKTMHPPPTEDTNTQSQQTPAGTGHHQVRRSQHSSSSKRKHRPSSRSSTNSASKTPLGCCAQLTKIFLFLANLLFWTTGAALGSWGILNLVDDHKYNLSQLLVFEPNGRMSLFQLLSWSFITLGCATVLVGFCGCSAILKNNRWILGLYIFLILAIFALDLATGLLAIIFQERLVASVRLKLANKLRSDYGVHASFTAALDYIQTRYECCGSEGHFDYEQSLWRLQRLGGFEATVARTCCHLRNTYDDQAHVNPRPVNESMCQSTDVRFHQSYRYRKGCIDDLERLIRQKIWNFIMGCGGAGAVILISLMFATCFCRLIPKSGSRKPSTEHSTGSRNHQQQHYK